MKKDILPENTKERLLETSEKLFADKGYNGVTIRDITRSAECNVAAVNYYFGNKENLYFDVIRQRIIPKMTDLRTQIDDFLAGYEKITLETVIRALVMVFLKNNILTKPDEVFHRLVNSEGLFSAKAKEIIVNDALVPFYDNLMDLFRPYFPPEMSESKIKLHFLSILAMIFYFSHSPLSVTRFTRQDYDDHFKNQLIEHMVAFALHGLKGNVSRRNE